MSAVNRYSIDKRPKMPYIVLSCFSGSLSIFFFVLFTEDLQGIFMLFYAFKISSEAFLYHLIIITLVHMLV